MTMPRAHKLYHDTPHVLNLYLSTKCNLDCRYCFVNKKGWGDAVADEKSIRRSIDILFAYPGKRKTISFSGGEPLLEFDLIKKVYGYAVLEAQKKGIHLDAAVTTNGTLLTRGVVDYFTGNGIILQVSIDGERATHDCNRPFAASGDMSSFDVIMDHLRHLQPRPRDLAVSMVFRPDNIQSLIKNISFLNGQLFSMIDFFPDFYAQWSLDGFKTAEKVIF